MAIEGNMDIVPHWHAHQYKEHSRTSLKLKPTIKQNSVLLFSNISINLCQIQNNNNNCQPELNLLLHYNALLKLRMCKTSDQIRKVLSRRLKADRDFVSRRVLLQHLTKANRRKKLGINVETYIVLYDHSGLMKVCHVLPVQCCASLCRRHNTPWDQM